MKRNSIFLIACLLPSFYTVGQSYYDDDIYYDASKAKEEKIQLVPASETRVETIYTEDVEEPTYQVYNNSPRDVDEYNRRGGIYAQKDTVSAPESEETDVFAYTEKIERFDNPEIIRNSDDDRLKELYYAGDVNIYIGTPSTTYVAFDFFSPWYSPWYNTWYSPWHYSSWYYSPWSYSWGYYPYGWYDPFWGHGWYYPHHHYYSHHHHNHWGGGYPNRYYSDNGRRPFGGGRSSGYSSNSGRRPMTTSGRYDTRTTTGRRPSSSSYIPTTRPTQTAPSNHRTTTYTNGYRGGATTVDRPSTINTNRNNGGRINRNTTPSYNNRNNNSNRTPSFNNSRPTTNRGGGFRGSSGGGRGSFGGGRGGRR